MILFGEKLNSSIPSVLEIMQSKNDAEIIRLCKAQEEAGADYLDINTAILADDELDTMLHIIELVQANTNCGIMLDSPSVEVLALAGKTVKRPLILNSITLDERHELIDLAVELGCSLVALPIDEYGLCDSDERVENAKKLVEICEAKGLSAQKLFIDAVIESVAVNPEAPMNAINTIRRIKAEIPNVKTTCGLSNISFGLPKRININTAFVCASIVAGLDSAIIDVLSPKTQDAIASANVIAGNDEFCMEYIERFRD